MIGPATSANSKICVARAVALGGREIDRRSQDLPPAIRHRTARHAQQSITPTGRFPLSTTALAEMERMNILRVFEQANGDKVLTGKMLGISRATLYRKLKRYNIPVKAEPGAPETESRVASGLAAATSFSSPSHPSPPPKTVTHFP